MILKSYAWIVSIRRLNFAIVPLENVFSIYCQNRSGEAILFLFSEKWRVSNSCVCVYVCVVRGRIRFINVLLRETHTKYGEYIYFSSSIPALSYLFVYSWRCRWVNINSCNTKTKLAKITKQIFYLQEK